MNGEVFVVNHDQKKKTRFRDENLTNRDLFRSLGMASTAVGPPITVKEKKRFGKSKSNL